jgi:5-methylcytosine-specific restriction endonuclease McrA
MPSSPNYKRNYKQEAATESDERKQARVDRHRARRMLEKAVGTGRVKGKDVDHKTPISQGGATTLANLRAINPSVNRSYPRNPDGSIKKGKK